MEARPPLTLAEQVLAAELAYYQQLAGCPPTPDDLTTWHQYEQAFGLLRRAPRPFQRHVLERHGYSLHRYMATHLGPAAWQYWFAHGSLVAPGQQPSRAA